MQAVPDTHPDSPCLLHAPWLWSLEPRQVLGDNRIRSVRPNASKLTGWDRQGAVYLYFFNSLKIFKIFSYIYFFKSSRIFAFLTKWMGWVISAAQLEPGASPPKDLSQNKEKAQDCIWNHKSPIRKLRITYRKTFYMNWTQIHKSKEVHWSLP